MAGKLGNKGERISKKYKKNKRIKRFNGLLCAVAVFMFLFFAYAAYVHAREYLDTIQQLETCRAEQRKAVERNIELVNSIVYHDSDEYVEKIAREQLGLVKPNEIVFIDENK